MSPAQCPQCGKEISAEDAPCPHCGASRKPSGAASPPSSFRKPPPPPRPAAPEAQPPETLDLEAPSFTFTPMHGLLALGALLMIAIFWYGIIGPWSSEKPGGSSAPAPASSPAPSQEAPAQEAPAAAPAAPRLTAAERQAANDVLEVLKAVQSMTAGGTTFQEYVSRVRNAKVQVEEYLGTEGGDRTIKEPVSRAMLLYLLAAAAWNAKTVNRQSEYEAVGTHSTLAFCPDLRPLLDTPPPTGVERTPAMNRGVNLTENLDRLWSCAAERVADAERALRALSG